MGGSETGKTYVSIALGLAAIAAGYRVRFIPVMKLIQELLQAESEYRLPRYIRTSDKYDLVILDELGYVSLAQGGPLLFQFCADRYEKGSLLVTTNLEFARWTDVFHDATLTTALLDRAEYTNVVVTSLLRKLTGQSSCSAALFQFTHGEPVPEDHCHLR